MTPEDEPTPMVTAVDGGTEWIHRVWVLVPLLPPRFDGLVEGRFDQQGDVLVHSGSDRVRRLRQTCEPQSDEPDLDCTDIALVDVAGIRFLTAVLHLVPDPAEATQSTIMERRLAIETYCREVVADLVVRLGLESMSIPWVNRTLVVDDFTEDNAVWLSPRPVPVSPTGVSGDRPQMKVSWGNNLVLASAFDDPDARQMLRVGMIDAQAVWLDLEAIGTDAETLVHKQLTDPGGVPLGAGRTESLLMSVARHNLLYDEVLIHSSSARSAVAKALLVSWGYENLRDRIDQRVRDSDAIDQRRRMRRAARHESRVSKVLLMLSLLSGAQLVLAVVGLAYSGGTASYPGVSRWSIFHWARAVGADVWLVLTVALAGLGYWRLQVGGDAR